MQASALLQCLSVLPRGFHPSGQRDGCRQGSIIYSTRYLHEQNHALTRVAQVLEQVPKPAGTSCFWEWIRAGPIPGLERARRACDWNGRWGALGTGVPSLESPETRSRLARGRPWHLALSSPCHL